MMPSPDVLSRTVDGEEALLDLATQAYFGLNATGTLVWKLLKKGKSLDEIAAALAAEFDVLPATARRDAAALLDVLKAKGLVRVEK